MNIMDAMSGSSERVGGRILSESNDIISLVDQRPRKRQAPQIHDLYQNKQYNAAGH